MTNPWSCLKNLQIGLAEITPILAFLVPTAQGQVFGRWLETAIRLSVVFCFDARNVWADPNSTFANNVGRRKGHPDQLV